MIQGTFGVLVLVALLAGSLGCFSGPRRMSRAWDDHVNQRYSEDAWVHGVLLQDAVPVYGIVSIGAALGDLFGNAYYFWSKDLWDRKRTGYEHRNPTGTTKTVAGSGL